MNNLHLSFMIISICFSTLSCSTDPPNEDIVGNDGNAVSQLFEIYDSFTVDYNNNLYSVTDFKHGYYTMYNFGEPWILIVSEDGKKFFEINQMGDGPNQYGTIRGVSLVDHETIVVCDTYNYYFFDYEGTPKGFGTFPEDYIFLPIFRIFSVENYKDEQGELYLVLLGDGKLVKTDPLQRDLIALYNVRNKQFRFGVKFDRALYEESVFPVNKLPLFDVDISNYQNIKVVFPYQKSLRSYSLENFELVNETATRPKYFTKMETLGLKPGDEQKRGKKYFKLEYINSQYFYVKSTEAGFTIIAYKVRCKEDLEDPETIAGIGDLSNTKIPCWKNYIQVFKNGKKIANDIPIDPRYSIEGIFDIDHILLLQRYPEEEENKFYRGRVVIK